jgi:hypothetical protein
MTEQNGGGYAVRLPRFHGGLPPGERFATLASNREPGPTAAVQAAAAAAVREDDSKQRTAASGDWTADPEGEKSIQMRWK